MTWTIPDQGEASNDLQSELFQSSLDALAAGLVRTGVVSGCAVTAQASPDMTVAVAAGTVMLAGVPATVAAGNVTIGTADATNPRLDLIVSDGSGTKSVIAGTAAAAPKEATLDTTTYVALAQVYVPAAATTITTARIGDRRASLYVPPVFDYPRTFPLPLGNQSSQVLNNRIYALRVYGSGVISKLRIIVGTASGNICVGVYRNSGAGLSAVPGTRIATSGSVSCPVAGVADVSLGGSVAVQEGDWFAIMADGNTASFRAQGSGNSGTAYTGMVGFTGTGGNTLPLPSPLTLTTWESKVYEIVGVT